MSRVLAAGKKTLSLVLILISIPLLHLSRDGFFASKVTFRVLASGEILLAAARGEFLSKCICLVFALSHCEKWMGGRCRLLFSLAALATGRTFPVAPYPQAAANFHVRQFFLFTTAVVHNTFGRTLPAKNIWAERENSLMVSYSCGQRCNQISSGKNG